jgi:hypothetical protein
MGTIVITFQVTYLNQMLQGGQNDLYSYAQSLIRLYYASKLPKNKYNE